jgi:hypothetical protein
MGFWFERIDQTLPGLAFYVGPHTHQIAELLNQFGPQSGPSGLMAGSDARAIVSVKVFIEENKIPWGSAWASSPEH